MERRRVDRGRDARGQLHREVAIRVGAALGCERRGHGVLHLGDELEKPPSDSWLVEPAPDAEFLDLGAGADDLQHPDVDPEVDLLPAGQAWDGLAEEVPEVVLYLSDVEEEHILLRPEVPEESARRTVCRAGDVLDGRRLVTAVAKEPDRGFG